MGFGIGHGILQEWDNKGWIFTFGEAALYYGGIAMFLGFHAWEIFDLWKNYPHSGAAAPSHAAVSQSAPSLSFAATPVRLADGALGGGLGLRARF